MRGRLVYEFWGPSLIRSQQIRNSSTATATVHQEEQVIKSYDEVPGPKPLPLIGNLWRLIPGVVGSLDPSNLLRMHQQLHAQYGDVVKLTGIGPRNDLLFVNRPEDVECIFRNEGTWPSRPNFRSVAFYRHKTRKDFFEGLGGVLIDQGAAWQAARTQVNPVLMQTKAVNLYTKKINDVAQDFVNRIPEFRDDRNVLKPDFINEMYKWALESIAQVTLDTRLGCLEPNLAPDSEPQLIINSVQTSFKLLHVLEAETFLWMLVPTPSWRKFVKTSNWMLETSMKYIERAMVRLKDSTSDEFSVLGTILRRDANPKRAIVMVLDMIFAGVDTTSYAVAHTLLQLANHPAQQERLFQELTNFMPELDTPVTGDMLGQMRYLKACIRETLRLNPIFLANARTTQQEIVISNYRIPKDVDIIMTNAVMSLKNGHFPRATEFLPERWLRTEVTSKPNPFVSLPFGHGARKCVGMRFASLEMEALLAKLVRRFRWEWDRPPMRYSASIINAPVDPLQFTVKDRLE